MPRYSDDTCVRDVLADLRRAKGLPLTPSEATTWSFGLAGATPSLPNFSWRKRAIDRHDLHHVLIDQPCTLKGECQVATWEFAAGAYPDIRPQIFCLPLVAAGFLTAPRQTWNTFRTGRRQQSLYGIAIDDTAPLGDLRRHINARDRQSGPLDPVRFAVLLTASFAVVLGPLVIAAALLF